MMLLRKYQDTPPLETHTDDMLYRGTRLGILPSNKLLQAWEIRAIAAVRR